MESAANRGEAGTRLKYFLVRLCYDYEGTFGDVEEFDTEEDVLAAAQQHMAQQRSEESLPGYGYTIIHGVELISE